MKISAALLSLAFAQDGDASQGAQGASQGAQDSQGAQSEGAQSGYGEQAESYGQEPQAESYGQESYGAEAYAAPVAYEAPEICLGGCPKEAPCQSANGACVARHQYVSAEYGAASYGAQESYGEAQQSGYRRLSSAQCPEGTTDISKQQLSNTVVLWVAFALLFLPALFFFFCTSAPTNTRTTNVSALTQEQQNFAAANLSANGNDTVTLTQTRFYLAHRYIAGVICFIASVAYLTMALGYGYTVRCCDGRSFYYARYIDWTITTPLLLWEVLDVSNMIAPHRHFIYFLDLLMIISGLIGSLICGGEKWIFFGFSMLCFIPILFQLCALNRKFNHMSNQVLQQAVYLIVISWFFYPIVWILAEGTSTISANAEAILYTVLDIIAKSGLGWHFVSNQFAFSFRMNQIGGQGVIANGSML
jgi:bacteriorhodopsin